MAFGQPDWNIQDPNTTGPHYMGPAGPSYIDLVGASGDYTTKYLDIFTRYGAKMNLVYHHAEAGNSGSVPDYTDYSAGAVTVSNCFLDLEMPQAAIGEKNDVGAFGSTNLRLKTYQVRNGMGYFSPNMTFVDESEPYTLHSNITFADVANIAVKIRDVWTVSYGFKAWHVFNPLPVIMQGEIVMYAANLVERGTNYDPFSLVWDNITISPQAAASGWPGQVVAGYQFPTYGIDYT